MKKPGKKFWQKILPIFPDNDSENRDFTSLYSLDYHNTHSFKLIYDLTKGSRSQMAAATIGSVVGHSPVWVLPLVTAGVINAIEDSGPNTVRQMLIYTLIGLASVAQNVPVCTWLQARICTMSRNIEVRLRSALVRRVQLLSMGFHANYRSGKLHSKILRDAENFHNMMSVGMPTAFRAIYLLLTVMLITIFREPAVAIFFILVAPVTTVLIRTFRGKIQRQNREYRLELENMSSRVSDMIEMVPVTRAHALEEVETEKLDGHLERIRKKGYKLDIITAIFGTSSWASFAIFQPICLLFTGYLAFKGRIQIGDIAMYQGFFQTIIGAVNTMMMVYPQLAKGTESLRSIGEILQCPDLEQNRGKKAVGKVNGKFEFENVGFVYPSSNEGAIKNFSLEIEPGQCIALVGHSGAGKSTLVNLIIGFYRSTSGRILLDGMDMNELDLQSYRRHLAVVTQNTLLFSGSIRENIAYGMPKVSNEEIIEAAEKANAMEFIDKLPHGLDTSIGEHGGRLSGGQRQRIAIARALIRDPKIIILDEATSALDVASEQLIQQAIERLTRNKTTFIVAHRLSTVRNADRIVVMKDGFCCEVGSHDELIAENGEFARMKSLQL